MIVTNEVSMIALIFLQINQNAEVNKTFHFSNKNKTSIITKSFSSVSIEIRDFDSRSTKWKSKHESKLFVEICQFSHIVFLSINTISTLNDQSKFNNHRRLYHRKIVINLMNLFFIQRSNLISHIVFDLLLKLHLICSDSMNQFYRICSSMNHSTFVHLQWFNESILIHLQWFNESFFVIFFVLDSSMIDKSR